MNEELCKSAQDAIQNYNDKHPHAKRLVKTTKTFSNQERIQLIQLGNKYYNESKLGQARKIFETINYYDGLLRVARYYAEKGKILVAYKLFHQLQSKESEVLEDRIVETLQKYMQES